MAPGSFTARLEPAGSATKTSLSPIWQPVHQSPPPTTAIAAGCWARASSGLSRPIGRRRWSIIFWGWRTGHLLLLLGSNASPETLFCEEPRHPDGEGRDQLPFQLERVWLWLWLWLLIGEASREESAARCWRGGSGRLRASRLA